MLYDVVLIGGGDLKGVEKMSEAKQDNNPDQTFFCRNCEKEIPWSELKHFSSERPNWYPFAKSICWPCTEKEVEESQQTFFCTQCKKDIPWTDSSMYGHYYYKGAWSECSSCLDEKRYSAEDEAASWFIDPNWKD